jgi:hypothetical protein
MPIESIAASESPAEREAALRDEVGRLVAANRDSRRLTAEVCRLLFHRYGEVPNANRVYTLTRRGSLTTVHGEVAAFWQEVRERSRIRIECPGLAPELAAGMGEFLTGLVATIEHRLETQLETRRQDIEARLREADLAVQAAAQEMAEKVGKAERAALAAEDRFRQADGAREQALQRLAVEQARVEQGQADAAAWQQRAETAQAESARSQAMFAAELAALRAALTAAEERAAGAELRALREIEAERTEHRKTAEQVKRTERALQARIEQCEALNREILARTSEAGILNGRLLALQDERDRALDAVRQREAELRDAAATLQGLRAELDQARAALVEAEQRTAVPKRKKSRTGIGNSPRE